LNGVGPTRQLPSGLRARERDKDISGPTLCLERRGAVLVQVRRVVAYRERVAVQRIDSLPLLPLKGPFRVLEINGRRLRAGSESADGRATRKYRRF